MINPEEIHEPYEYIDEVPNVIKLDSLPIYDRYDYDLSDDKSFNSYIHNIEQCVRTSFEYKQMVRYLRDYMDMNKCAFYENVNNIDTTKIRIEIHHAPFQLSDITRIVYNKRVAFNETLDEEMVAKEIMWLHYMTWVGLIPLAETIHELVHNNYIFIPSTAVYGKWKEFYSRYQPYMSPEQCKDIEDIIQASNLVDDSYRDILQKKYIYVDTSGAYKLPTMEEVTHILKNRITELMDDPQPVYDKPKELIQPLIFEN